MAKRAEKILSLMLPDDQLSRAIVFLARKNGWTISYAVRSFLMCGMKVLGTPQAQELLAEYWRLASYREFSRFIERPLAEVKVYLPHELARELENWARVYMHDTGSRRKSGVFRDMLRCAVVLAYRGLKVGNGIV